MFIIPFLYSKKVPLNDCGVIKIKIKYYLPLDRDVQVGDVPEGEVDESLEVVLAQMVLEGLPGELLAVLHGQETVLGEAVDASIHDVLTDLLSHFHDV